MSDELQEWRDSLPERWMIVRPSRTIPGGYRIVRQGLTEAQAREWAPRYSRPHEAMSAREVIERRMFAQGHSSSSPPGGDTMGSEET